MKTETEHVVGTISIQRIEEEAAKQAWFKKRFYKMSILIGLLVLVSFPGMILPLFGFKATGTWNAFSLFVVFFATIYFLWLLSTNRYRTKKQKRNAPPQPTQAPERNETRED